MKNILSLLFISLISFSSNARKPAVEPVSGLSIEQYQQTTNDNGFNWSNAKERPKTKNTHFPYWIGLLLLPIASMYLLKKRSEELDQNHSEFNNLSDLDSINNSKQASSSSSNEEDKDDHNFPMAS